MTSMSEGVRVIPSKFGRFGSAAASRFLRVALGRHEESIDQLVPVVPDTADGRRAGRSDHRLTVCDIACGRALSTGTEEWLVSGLVEALPALTPPEVLDLRRDLLMAADYLVATVDTELNQVVGVVSSRWVTLPSGRACLHVLLHFVGERYRHDSVVRRSWARHFTSLLASGRSFPEVIVLKTSNPVDYHAIRAFSGHPDIDFYPGDAGQADAKLRALAAEAAATVSPGYAFDPRTGVIAGMGMPADLCAGPPDSPAPEVNEHLMRHLRPGDWVLAVLQARTPDSRLAILSALGVRTDRPQPRIEAAGHMAHR